MASFPSIPSVPSTTSITPPPSNPTLARPPVPRPPCPVVNRIRLLPDHVANQIAAGEVVERPASVVKELVENAIDARPSRIAVEIAAGGRSLIRVSDDGVGMSRDDALLCLERHATSKIQRAEDLSSITTMGFRGEALPSIASISRFHLVTREHDNANGEATSILVQGGKITEVHAAANPPGTSVEVRSLFFNLPARRKFLRSEETERAHIQHYLTLAALAHPGVGFTFTNEGRLVWELPPRPAASTTERLEALRERLRILHGGPSQWLVIDFESRLEATPDPDAPAILQEESPSHFHLWGLVGAPGVSRSTRDEQHLFVNRRPVENRGLNHALVEGYHTSLMKGRYPVCCLFLDIDPAAVDVNIHPAKREVKFREEGPVRRLVAKAVRQALEAHARTGLAAHAVAPTPPTAPTLPLPSRPIVAPPALVHPPSGGSGGSASPFPLSASPLPPSALPPSALPPSALPASPPPPSALPPSPLLSIPLRLVGVIGRLYVVLESDRGLVLLDQHAAHERILFEQMLHRMEADPSAPSQRLLLPETVELSARDADFLRRNLEAMLRLGVGLREFGERTFLLDSLPPFVKAKDPRRFTIDLVDALKAAGAGVNTLRLGEEMIAKTVCRHAVKANDPLAGPELEQLVADLRRCTMPYTCPHGRPTLIELGWRDLERRFGRAQ